MTEISDKDFQKLARERGFVRRTTPRRALAALDRRPGLLVDIGVWAGTKWFYEAFPDRPFLLVDPAPGAADRLAHRPARFDFVNKGLSDRAGTLDLALQDARSTFHDRTALTDWPTSARHAAEVMTFDALIAHHAPAGAAERIGVKIDTEGHELQVIRGIDAQAGAIDFLIAEVSVLNRFENGAGFAEVVGALAERGLRFYNILNPTAPRARRFFDCLFLPEADPAFDADGR